MAAPAGQEAGASTGGPWESEQLAEEHTGPAEAGIGSGWGSIGVGWGVDAWGFDPLIGERGRAGGWVGSTADAQRRQGLAESDFNLI